MLSRLISLLSRIPAVKWAFNRLRPAPHSGSIDVAPSTADEQGAVTAIAEAVPTAQVEPDVVEEAQAPSAEVEAIEPPEPVISSDPSADDDAEVAPDGAEQAPISPVEVEAAPVEAFEPVLEDEPAPVACLEIEAVALDETPAVVVDTEIAPVATDVAEDTIADAAVVAAQVEPPLAPAPKKPRAKLVEPADRAALIRQRWAETGIRMWNPRLHGTGDAALNIQGRIGLLPPEPGETMPRYDKLEFKMLGGQIVCEGVIVEASVHAGQRSFTRLAEPRGNDHAREPVRERQAVLA